VYTADCSSANSTRGNNKDVSRQEFNATNNFYFHANALAGKRKGYPAINKAEYMYICNVTKEGRS
jgi:hypothetical protein